MKNKIILSIITIFLVALMFGSVSAATIKTNETLFISEDINDDLYAAGGELYVSSKIVGDAALFGSIVKVEQDVSEDLLLFGSQVDVNGNIGDDARIIGSQINIDSQIGGDLIALGSQINIKKGSVINKDLILLGAMMDINANVNGDARLVGGIITINGPIQGDVKIDADTLRFGEGGVIRGNLEYVGEKPSFDESKVEGEITQSTDVPLNFKTKGQVAFGKIYFFLTLFVTGIFFMILAHNFTNRTTETIVNKSWLSLGIGILALIVVPIISIILLFTIVALPIGLFALMLWGFGIYFSLVFGAILTGKLIFGKSKINTFVALFLGALIFTLLTWIPVLGGIIIFAAILLGMGSMTLALFAHLKRKKVAKKKKKGVKLNKV